MQLLPGLSSRRGQSHWWTRKAHLAAARNRLAQATECLSTFLNASKVCSWEASTTSLARVKIRSDETWHMARLSFDVALAGAAREPRGRERGQPVAGRRMLPVIWSCMEQGPSPVASLETANVTAVARAQARSPTRYLRRCNLAWHFVKQAPQPPSPENSSDAAEAAASCHGLSASPDQPPAYLLRTSYLVRPNAISAQPDRETGRAPWTTRISDETK